MAATNIKLCEKLYLDYFKKTIRLELMGYSERD